MGSAILPTRVTGTGEFAQLAFFPNPEDARLRRLASVASRAGGDLVRTTQYPGGVAAFFTPGFLLQRQHWAAIGVRDFRLQEARSQFDLSDRPQMRRLLSDALTSLGLTIDDIQPRLLGSNRFGEPVQDGILGRSITRKGVAHAEWQPGANGVRKGALAGDAFFRGDQPAFFSGSARGAALMVLKGERFSAARLAELHAAVVAGSPHLEDAIGYRLIDFQEEIEAHLASMVTPNSRRVPGRELVMRVDDAMAVHADRTGKRMLLQQYSTPFPIARVAFETMMPQPGERLLEPTIGNVTLASSFLGRDLTITGVELDPARARRASRVLGEGQGVVEQGDFEAVAQAWSSSGPEPRFDLVVANPPFAALDAKVSRVDALGRLIPLSSLDHVIAFEALLQRTAEGRAFLVLPADMMRGGALKGAKRYFDNWLRSTYEIAGSAAVDGRLYRKMGTEFPVLLYAVGPLRERALTTQEIQAIEPEALDVIMSHDELFAWADVTQARMMELTGLRLVEVAPGVAEVSSPAAGGVQPVPAVEPQVPSAAAPSPSGVAAASDAEPHAPGVASAAAPGREAGSGARASPAAARPPVPRAGVIPAPAVVQGEVVPATEAPETFTASPPAATPVVPSLPQSTVLVDDIEDDPFVRRYEPFSNQGEARTQIQKSLQGAVYRALLDVETTYGDVDEFVAGKLQLTVNDLPARFSPEQIDALALNFARQAQGRGFLAADLMGVGKGRFLAGTMVAAFVENRPTIFITEGAHLFSDFLARDLVEVMRLGLRDMKETGFLRPFIFNQSVEAQVRDVHGAKLFGTGDLKAARDDGLPAETNMVMLTYSQLQTKYGSWKLRAILDWANASAAEGHPVHLVLDEVHRAAGEDSNTGALIESLVHGVTNAGGSVTYSSATPLKSGRNIRIYEPILPEMNMSTTALTSLIEANPLALQEVLSSEMARMGTIIAREVDSRGAVRRFIHLQDIDPERHAEVVSAVDRTSAFLREIVDFSPRIDAAAKRFSSAFGGTTGGGAEAKVTVSTTSPVSQFHTFSQYLLIAAKSAFIKDLVVQAVAMGKKPVVVVENTGKEVLARLAEREGTDLIVDGVSVRHITRLPDMGDVLIENASKLLDVKVTDPLGNVEHQRLEEFEPWLRAFTLRVRGARLESLVVAPLDLILQIGRELDLTVGELTKRQLMAEPLASGGFAVVTRDPGDKRVVIRDFNNGDVDLIAMNRSAASGVSMHASPANGLDLRGRVMIKAQLQSEITQERQIDGRINRYGQVRDAEYWLPMTGFAADDRMAQLFNRKNRNLSATSNASRENRTNIDEAVDLLNPIGEGVVRRYLGENPHIAVALGLPTPGDEAAVEIDSYARRVMGRLVLLPIAKQDAVLSELDTSFRLTIEALNAKGQNPLRLNQFDWKATSETVAVLQAGDENSDQIGKRPVNLVKLTYKESVSPISWDRVLRGIERGLQGSGEKGSGGYVSPRDRLGAFIKPDGEPYFGSHVFDKSLSRRREDQSLGLTAITEEEAHEIWERRASIVFKDASVSEKRVLRAIGYAEFLDRQLDMLVPGTVISASVDFYPSLAETPIARLAAGEGVTPLLEVPAVITRVSFDINDPLGLGNWFVAMSVPGSQFTEDVTLSAAYSAAESFTPEQRERHGVVAEVFQLAGASFDTTRLIAGAEPSSLEKTAFNRSEIAFKRMDADYAWFRADQPHWSGYLEQAFDNAPSGEVRRTTHALEGNMFMAMQVSQSGGARLGQKAIYTVASGEIRHGVILKKTESIDKIRAQLVGRLDAIASPVPYRHPKLVEALATFYGVVSSLGADYVYLSSGRMGGDRRGKIEEAAVLLVSRGQPSEAAREYVAKNLDDLVNEARFSMAAKTLPEMFVGSDSFGEADDLSVTMTTRRPARDATHKPMVDVTDRTDMRALASLAGTIGGDDIHAVFLSGVVVMLFDKKGSAVVSALEAAGVSDPLEYATNKITGGAKLTKGTVGLSFDHKAPMGSQATLLAVSSVMVSIADQTHQPLLMRGPLAKVVSVLEQHAGKVQDLSVSRQLDLQQDWSEDQDSLINDTYGELR